MLLNFYWQETCCDFLIFLIYKIVDKFQNSEEIFIKIVL